MSQEPPDYPPADHVLRDLPFVIHPTDDGARAVLTPVDVHPDELAVVVDVLAGSVCAQRVAPDWMATSSLAMRWSPVLPAPLDGGVDLSARVLRAGSKVVTIEVVGSSVGGGDTVAVATVTFSRLPRRADTITFVSDVPGAPVSFDRDGGWPPRRLAERLDAAARPPGPTEVPGELVQLVDPLRNSFGALNGGVVAGLCRRAAALSVPGGTTTGLHVHHLGQVRHGPVRTRARIELGDPGTGGCAVRVELVDEGPARDAAAGGPPRPSGAPAAVAHVDVAQRP